MLSVQKGPDAAQGSELGSPYVLRLLRMYCFRHKGVRFGYTEKMDTFIRFVHGLAYLGNKCYG